MNNSPINSITVEELADATSLTLGFLDSKSIKPTLRQTEPNLHVTTPAANSANFEKLHKKFAKLILAL